MTTAAPDQLVAPPEPARTGSGERTLEQSMGMAWAALARGYPVACPVCDGAMHPQPDRAAARCSSCGSELS